MLETNITLEYLERLYYILLAFLEGCFCNLHSVRELQPRQKSYGVSTQVSRADRNQLGTWIQIGPLHTPWYINFHTRHEVAICTIYTPCKKMTIDDVIV